MDDAIFSGLLDLIYEAPAAPAAWQDILVGLSAEFGCHSANVIRRNLSAGTLDYFEHGNDAATVHEYLSVWDSRNLIVQKTRVWRDGAIEADHDIVAREQFLASDYYNGFLKPREFDAVLRLTIAANGVHREAISLLRSERRGLFDDHDRRRAETVMSHFQRAARLAARVERAGLLASAASGLLDLNPIGVILLDHRQRVIFANRAALDMAARNDCFSLRRDRMEAVSPANNSALQALLASAVRSVGARGGAVALSRIGGERDLVVAAGRIPISAASFFGHPTAAYVLVSDPLAAHAPPLQIVQQLFGLTGAEARICEHLAEGESLEEAAASLEIKMSTARWHLRGLFQKMGVTRQSQLMRLMKSLPWA